MPSFKSFFLAAALAASVAADTIKITAMSDNTFSPNSVQASKGDTIEFHFEPKNHSVVAGDYQYPCSPMQLGEGFFSGFVPVQSGEASKVFRVMVNNTDPMPFYSSQGDECPHGMVGIINPSQNQTLNDYKTSASKLSSGVSPGKTAYGGQFASSSGSSTSTSTSTSTSSASTSTSTSNKKGDAGSLRVSMVALLGLVGISFFMA